MRIRPLTLWILGLVLLPALFVMRPLLWQPMAASRYEKIAKKLSPQLPDEGNVAQERRGVTKELLLSDGPERKLFRLACDHSTVTLINRSRQEFEMVEQFDNVEVLAQISFEGVDQRIDRLRSPQAILHWGSHQLVAENLVVDSYKFKGRDLCIDNEKPFLTAHMGRAEAESDFAHLQFDKPKVRAEKLTVTMEER